MSDVRIRAARGLIASVVRSASKEARQYRREAGEASRRAEENRQRANLLDEQALAAERESSTIQNALNELP